MRTKAEIYADLSKAVRYTGTYNTLIRELYELICDEADTEYGLLKAYGLSDDQIFDHADTAVQEVLNAIREADTE